MFNSTRTTARPSALRGRATVSTGFASAVTKILAVYFAVAILAERHAVADIEAQIGIISPRLDMMSVNIPIFLAAPLAGLIVAGVDRYAPLLDLRRKPCAFSFKRLAVLPRAGQWANSFFSCTVARAIASAAICSSKALAAAVANLLRGGITYRPTRLRAVARFTFAWPALIGRAADFTYFHNTALGCHCFSRWIRMRTASDRLSDMVWSAATSVGVSVSVTRSEAPTVVGRPAPGRLPPRLGLVISAPAPRRCSAGTAPAGCSVLPRLPMC